MIIAKEHQLEKQSPYCLWTFDSTNLRYLGTFFLSEKNDIVYISFSLRLDEIDDVILILSAKIFLLSHRTIDYPDAVFDAMYLYKIFTTINIKLIKLEDEPEFKIELELIF